jgi:hypothetical protein
MRKSSRLPSRFPVGTKYVLESRGGVVHRYVEYPDGSKFALSPREPATCECLALSIVPEIAATAPAPKPRRKPARTVARRRARTLERV